MPEPTADTFTLIEATTRAIEEIYRAGVHFSKAGVFLSDLTEENRAQAAFLSAGQGREEILRVVDRLNARFGRGTIFPAALGIKRAWALRAAQRSPRYTTRWDEVLTVA